MAFHSRPRACQAIAAAAAGLVACAPGADPVAFGVVRVGDDPFLGADELVVQVHATDGTLLSEGSFDPSTRELVTPPLPFATDLSIVVETRLRTPSGTSVPLARGRSYPFRVDARGSGPSGSPDVTLGVLARHASIGDAPGSGPVVAIAATPDGALLATETDITAWHAHGPAVLPVADAPTPLPPERVGACFIPLGTGFLAVGGAAEGASVLDAQGQLVASTAPGELAVSSGAAMARLDARTALIVGGRDAAGIERAEVTRIELDAAGIPHVIPLAPLAAPRSGAQALALSVMSDRGVSVPRLLVAFGQSGGIDATDVVVIDPAPVAALPPRTIIPPSGMRDAALAAVGNGLVVFAGGRDAAGTALANVALLFVHADLPLAFFSPPPGDLFVARSGAHAITLAPGVAMVLGGLDGTGAAIGACEMVDLHTPPGIVYGTGSLPAPAADVVTALLGDGSLLVAAGRALTLYFPHQLDGG